jgi:shikimate dehydrogenase
MVEPMGVAVTLIEPADTGALAVDLVVNATPVGAPGQERSHPSLPPLGSGVLVVDLLYDPVSTDLQQAAREAGAAVFGGLGHLLEQAALAFELWTGTPAPLEVMSAAALAALAEH